MGKNKVLRTLGKRIGNTVLHKLLVKYTNIPESISHLENEELEYRDAAIKEAKRHHWNMEDKDLIKTEAINFIKDRKDKRYPDILFPLEEAKKLVEEEIIDLGL